MPGTRKTSARRSTVRKPSPHQIGQRPKAPVKPGPLAAKKRDPGVVCPECGVKIKSQTGRVGRHSPGGYRVGVDGQDFRYPCLGGET